MRSRRSAALDDSTMEEEGNAGAPALSNPAPERKYRARSKKRHPLSLESKIRRWFVATTRRHGDPRAILLLPAAVLFCILFTQRYSISLRRKFDDDAVGGLSQANAATADASPQIRQAPSDVSDQRVPPSKGEKIAGESVAVLDRHTQRPSTPPPVTPTLKKDRDDGGLRGKETAKISPPTAARTISPTRAARRTPPPTSKRNKYTTGGGVCNLDGMSTGNWDTLSHLWSTTECHMERSSTATCLAHKKIVFYGDVALRSVALRTLAQVGQNDVEMAVEGKKPSYLMGGTKHHVNGGEIQLYWTPSAYSQWPSRVGNMDKDDISVIGIGVMDMMENYSKRGGHDVRGWYAAMKLLITDAARKRGRVNKDLFVMNIHKLQPSWCRVQYKNILNMDERHAQAKLERCEKCFTDDALDAFREALQSAVSCVRKEGHTNVHMIDPFGVTNSTDSNKFEKSHSVAVWLYDEVVTNVEVSMVLAAACKGLRHSSEDDDSCPASTHFDAGRKLQC